VTELIMDLSLNLGLFWWLSVIACADLLNRPQRHYLTIFSATRYTQP
jgi:hypothetical protein